MHGRRQLVVSWSPAAGARAPMHQVKTLRSVAPDCTSGIHSRAAEAPSEPLAWTGGQDRSGVTAGPRPAARRRANAAAPVHGPPGCGRMHRRKPAAGRWAPGVAVQTASRGVSRTPGAPGAPRRFGRALAATPRGAPARVHGSGACKEGGVTSHKKAPLCLRGRGLGRGLGRTTNT